MRQMIDVVVRGTLNSKTLVVVQVLIEEMTLNNYQWDSFGREKSITKERVYELNAV